METPSEIVCPACGKTSSVDSFFCPNCGAKIKEIKINTSISKQIVIYFISFFLSPFGLGYSIKYIKQPDPKARNIGIASLVLTILAIILMLWIGVTSINEYGKLLNGDYNLEGLL